MATASAPPLRAAAPAVPRPWHDPLVDILGTLYRQQLEHDPHYQYMIDHARPDWVWNQVQTFRWYSGHLPGGGKLLDWGCRHAPDSCMIRARFNRTFEQHGCDFAEPGQFKPFHDYADFTYTRLDDVAALPYPKHTFDAVIASGVLEHTALQYESLKELYRVMKPDGILVITYLPNLWSVQEWKMRTLQKRNFHQRYYGMGEARRLLKSCGFCPVVSDYQTFLWERLFGVRRDAPTARALRALLPLHWFCSTLCMVAIKVVVF